MANSSRVFEFITEVFGWLRIVASPTLIGLGIGAFIYLPSPTVNRLILAIFIVIAGLIVGIIWANRNWKGKGTMWFLSQTNSTPDLDDFREEIESKGNKNAADSLRISGFFKKNFLYNLSIKF